MKRIYVVAADTKVVVVAVNDSGNLCKSASHTRKECVFDDQDILTTRPTNFPPVDPFSIRFRVSRYTRCDVYGISRTVAFIDVEEDDVEIMQKVDM